MWGNERTRRGSQNGVIVLYQGAVHPCDRRWGWLHSIVVCVERRIERERWGRDVFDRKEEERTRVGTSSVSVHTVNITHLLRRSQTGDAEDPWGS